ncbi:MAG TPA: Clp protease N-terminal domain-containing protein [Pirellulales bacterium]|jgi:ATP-dependent Clp protease ATP-binding subunit ClpC|nr:Clp protease N-terminal domain-containing protein [Pirellulales bacterium]
MDSALQEAVQVGHSYTSTQFFLIAIVGMGSGAGADALRSRGIDVGKVRAELASDQKLAAQERVGYSKEALSFAWGEVRRRNDPELGVDHFVLGLLNEPDCHASLILARLGVDVDQLRTEVSGHLLRGSPQSGMP